MPERRRSRLGALRDTLGAVIGAVLGLTPHVLHHLGLIAGTAFVTGAAGNVILYAVGLLLSMPMLRRLHAKFGTWLAPAIAAVAFTALFLLSAVVIGPAISAGQDGDQAPPAPPPSPTGEHTGHHP